MNSTDPISLVDRSRGRSAETAHLGTDGYVEMMAMSQAPIRHLVNYGRKWLANRGGATGIPLEQIPAGLLLRIASHLPAESAAALALTSKDMLVKVACVTDNNELGEREQISRLAAVVKSTLPAASLLSFLELLEKDEQWLVRCDLCLKLHLPNKTSALGINGGSELVGECLKTENCLPYIAPSIRLPLVRGAIRIGSFQLDPSIWLSQIDTVGICKSPGINSSREVAARTAGGHVIVKEELIIQPFAISPMGQITASELFYLFNDLKDAPLCRHTNWDKAYPELQPTGLAQFVKTKPRGVPPRLLKKTHFDSQVLSAQDLRAAFPASTVCNMLHGPDDTDDQGWCDEDQVGPAERRSGTVNSCETCHTDHCMTWGSLTYQGRSLGRVLYLTTWRDVGSGSITDEAWASHGHPDVKHNDDDVLPDGPRNPKFRASRNCQIFRAFEGWESTQWQPGVYEPKSGAEANPLTMRKLTSLDRRS